MRRRRATVSGGSRCCARGANTAIGLNRLLRHNRRVSRMADYVIVYLKRGSHVSSSPWRGDLESAKKVARDGLVRRSADAFQIRSDTLDGPLVWGEPRDS